MIRRAAIIAAMALNSFAWSATNASAEDGSGGFSAYKVELEVAHNGVPVCAQSATLSAGESSVVTPVPEQQGELRVLQRVTGFPGAVGSRALLEIEIYRDQGGRSKLIVAPTLGLELGQPETYEVSTTQGVVRIHAVVTGESAQAPADPDQLQFETMPARPDGM